MSMSATSGLSLVRREVLATLMRVSLSISLDTFTFSSTLRKKRKGERKREGEREREGGRIKEN